MELCRLYLLQLLKQVRATKMIPIFTHLIKLIKPKPKYVTLTHKKSELRDLEKQALYIIHKKNILNELYKLKDDAFKQLDYMREHIYHEESFNAESNYHALNVLAHLNCLGRVKKDDFDEFYFFYTHPKVDAKSFKYYF